MIKICVLSDIIKTRNILKNIPRFWYASSKHIPYSNKLPSQFVTNTPYVSPLKNCRTVVRQFLYYGVRVPTTRNNKNSEADKYLLRYFGTLEGTLVETHYVIKAKCKHLPTITSYVSPLPTKSLALWGPRKKECSRTLSQHNKNEEHPKGHSSFLVRWKGLEPPTYWFVAAKI